MSAKTIICPECHRKVHKDRKSITGHIRYHWNVTPSKTMKIASKLAGERIEELMGFIPVEEVK